MFRFLLNHPAYHLFLAIVLYEENSIVVIVGDVFSLYEILASMHHQLPVTADLTQGQGVLVIVLQLLKSHAPLEPIGD